MKMVPTMYAILDPDGDLVSDPWGLSTLLYATRAEAEAHVEDDETVVEVTITYHKEPM